MADIQALAIKDRGGIAGRHIITCSLPATEQHHALMTGSGAMVLSSRGEPFNETITFMREGYIAPQWKTPPAAPKIAEYLPMIRKLIREGRYQKAAELADTGAAQNGCPPTLNPAPSHPALVLSILQDGEKAQNYLHTLNMRTSVISTRWTIEGKLYQRDMFCSRRDNAAFIRLKCPVENSRIEIRGSFPDHRYERGQYGGNDVPGGRKGNFDSVAIAPAVTIAHTPGGILLDGVYSYEKGSFASAVRVWIPSDGRITCGEDSLIITGAGKILLFISSEKNSDNAEHLLNKLEKLPPDFNALLNRHTDIHMPIFDRLSVDLGGDENDYLLSTTELKHKQFLSKEIVPAYMEAMTDMGRFFLLNECGEFPPIHGHVNVNINHQISGGNIGRMPELMESFFKWIEWQLPDARENAKNILGARGIFIACHPDTESGKLNHFNEYWPHHYWISSTGWCLNPFLEHYYCTGDEDFLKNRTLPLYKETALLYEDFLTEYDANGKLMFLPSYSPENFPANVPVMAVINAVMDISVCREVLTVLLTLGKKYGVGTAEDYSRWEKILRELPEYLTGRYGELKEWAWKDFEERYDHRHVSQLYGAYPGDEFQPELDKGLYQAAFISNRMRALGNESCHGIMHRAQAAARLKDPWLVQKMLRFVLESGYVNDGFTTAHNPYLKHIFPDGQGALPTVLLESLCYSRPGFIEPLPALPEGSFSHGKLCGMSLRSFVFLDEMCWDLAKGVITLTITPLQSQKIMLCYRRGIADLRTSDISAVSRAGNDRFEITLEKQQKMVLDIDLLN
jgi:hypothetical protein